MKCAQTTEKETLISVIIPIYNVADFLAHTLNSVIQQDYRNLQIICVDDGSTDNSPAILEEYARKDSRFCIVTQQNQGVSSARNAGINRAQGSYIIFLDGDDWLDSNTCSQALSTAMEYDADVVMWGYRKEYSHHSEIVQPIKKLTIFDGQSLKSLHCRLIGPNGEDLSHPENLDSLGIVWGKLMKLKPISDNNLQFSHLKDIGSSEDVLFNVQLFSHIRKVVFTPKILHHYRKDNASSITRLYRSKLITQWNHLFSLMESEAKQLPYATEAKLCVRNRISLSVIGLGLNILNSGHKWHHQYAELSHLINSSWYREAIKHFPLHYFPAHWKLFFFCAKYRLTCVVYTLLHVIRRILSHNR